MNSKNITKAKEEALGHPHWGDRQAKSKIGSWGNGGMGRVQWEIKKLRRIGLEVKIKSGEARGRESFE